MIGPLEMTSKLRRISNACISEARSKNSKISLSHPKHPPSESLARSLSSMARPRGWSLNTLDAAAAGTTAGRESC